MIFKTYDINKFNISKYSLFLFYGENQGLKEEIIEKNFRNVDFKSLGISNIFFYDGGHHY